MLEQALVERFINLNLQSNSNLVCCICQDSEDLITKKTCFLTESCGHLFHKNCIENWLSSDHYKNVNGNKFFCPNCKTEQKCKSFRYKSHRDSYLKLLDKFHETQNDLPEYNEMKESLLSFIKELYGIDKKTKICQSLVGSGMSGPMTWLNTDGSPVINSTYNFNLPTNISHETAGEVLTSSVGGSNAMTWTTGNNSDNTPSNNQNLEIIDTDIRPPYTLYIAGSNIIDNSDNYSLHIEVNENEIVDTNTDIRPLINENTNEINNDNYLPQYNLRYSDFYPREPLILYPDRSRYNTIWTNHAESRVNLHSDNENDDNENDDNENDDNENSDNENELGQNFSIIFPPTPVQLWSGRNYFEQSYVNLNSNNEINNESDSNSYSNNTNEINHNSSVSLNQFTLPETYISSLEEFLSLYKYGSQPFVKFNNFYNDNTLSYVNWLINNSCNNCLIQRQNCIVTDEIKGYFINYFNQYKILWLNSNNDSCNFTLSELFGDKNDPWNITIKGSLLVNQTDNIVSLYYTLSDNVPLFDENELVVWESFEDSAIHYFTTIKEFLLKTSPGRLGYLLNPIPIDSSMSYYYLIENVVEI